MRTAEQPIFVPHTIQIHKKDEPNIHNNTINNCNTEKHSGKFGCASYDVVVYGVFVSNRNNDVNTVQVMLLR